MWRRSPQQAHERAPWIERALSSHRLQRQPVAGTGVKPHAVTPPAHSGIRSTSISFTSTSVSSCVLYLCCLAVVAVFGELPFERPHCWQHGPFYYLLVLVVLITMRCSSLAVVFGHIYGSGWFTYGLFIGLISYAGRDWAHYVSLLRHVHLYGNTMQCTIALFRWCGSWKLVTPAAGNRRYNCLGASISLTRTFTSRPEEAQAK